jgi:hypothetical protein
MKDHTAIVLRDVPVASTPCHFGVNVEIQDHHNRTNLWDWLADSGATCVREFHPEQTLRPRPADPRRLSSITSREGFDTWRKKLMADPDSTIAWNDFSFSEPLPWLGVPDGIADMVRQVGVEPLYSLGYAPAQFERPLVADPERAGPVSDDRIDWGAAASAYEYYFAVMWRYAARYGARYFTMVNEPENRFGWFAMRPDVAELSWQDLFHGASGGTFERFSRCLASQYGVLARLARRAMDDVRTALPENAQAESLFLSGPTSVLWRPLWEASRESLDILDFHHYHEDPSTFEALYQAAAEAVGPDGRVGLSEFNRFSGGMPLGGNLFDLDNSLAVARLLMRVLRLCAPGDPRFEFACFYLLHFPSTHRNYKQLLYGDMNLVDWSGRDTALWNRVARGYPPGRTGAGYPTFDEQQARFATPAYAMFRMLARCVRDERGGLGPHDVLATGMVNPTSSGPRDIADQLEVLAVRQPTGLVVHVLNTSDRPARNCVLELPAGLEDLRFAVVRFCDRTRRDVPGALADATDGPVRLDVPARSLVQVRYTARRLDAVGNARLEEATFTPGRADGLGLWQTTRLRALGEIDGQAVDLSDGAVAWTSDDPDVVRVDGTGLVQRVRESRLPTTIAARLPRGDTLSIEIRGQAV